MSPEDIRGKHESLRRKLTGITPTLDRELLLFACEMLAELAAQQAELNQKFRKEEQT
jgi:hypothetical protein